MLQHNPAQAQGGLGSELLKELITRPLEVQQDMVTAHPSKEETIVDCEEWC